MMKLRKFFNPIRPLYALVSLMTIMIAILYGGLLRHKAKTIEEVSGQQRSFSINKQSFPAGVIEVVEVNKLSSPNFAKDLEFAIKNISSKKIYGVHIRIQFPNAKIDSIKVGSKLYYGARRLIGENARANPEDIPLEPGQIAKLKLTQDRIDALNGMMTTRGLPLSAFDHLEFICLVVNFGDGTGYVGGAFHGAKISFSSPKSDTRGDSPVSQSNFLGAVGRPGDWKNSLAFIEAVPQFFTASNTKLTRPNSFSLAPLNPSAPPHANGCNYWYYDEHGSGNCYSTCYPDFAQYGGAIQRWLCVTNIGCVVPDPPRPPVTLDCFEDDLYDNCAPNC